MNVTGKTATRVVMALMAIAILILSGCAQVPRASVVGEQEQINMVEPPPRLANGSIYQGQWEIGRASCRERV